MARRSVRIGDVLMIPLSNGSKAFGQYVCWDENTGPLIQVFNLISKEIPPVSDIISSGPKFPPVCTGLQAAIKIGMWEVIGRSDVKDFKFPVFRNGTPGPTGRVKVWWLYNGVTETRVGELPPGAEKYEVRVVWGQDSLARRIETGINPYDNW